MKPRLVILSDLWGKQKSAWITMYIENLQNTFDIQYYDCCEIGTIDTTIYSQENLHQQFTSFGIEKAVATLLNKEKEPFHLIAFSIGGTIAWKAALLGLPLISLHAISATRLRYEVTIPTIDIVLYFGEEDKYKPTKDWCEKFSNASIIFFEDELHEMYKREKIAIVVCNNIKEGNQYI